MLNKMCPCLFVLILREKILIYKLVEKDRIEVCVFELERPVIFHISYGTAFCFFYKKYHIGYSAYISPKLLLPTLDQKCHKDTKPQNISQITLWLGVFVAFLSR